jgi:hypothetical protein
MSRGYPYRTPNGSQLPLSAVPGPPEVRVGECSLWPEHAGCEQKCAEQAAAH